MEHEGDGDTVVVDVLRTVHKGLERRLEELEIRKNRYHLDHSSVEIGQNTEKSSGYSRGLADT